MLAYGAAEVNQSGLVLCWCCSMHASSASSFARHLLGTRPADICAELTPPAQLSKSSTAHASNTWETFRCKAVHAS